MRQVLLFTLEYPPDRGGIATYLANLHRNISEVTVIRAKEWVLWPRWLPMIGQLFRAVRTRKIELVVLSHILPVGYAAMVVQWCLQTPFIVFMHGLDVRFATRNVWKRWWFRYILNRAEQIIANSEYTKALVEEHIKKENLVVLQPCVPAVAPRRKAEDDPVTLLTVGRLVKRKNHCLVLRVLANVKTEFPELRYIIVGDGPEREPIQKAIQSYGLESMVTLVPDSSDAARDAYYESADIFIAPTRSEGNDVEGFGVVFLEAARFGLPVIAGEGGGVAEAVVDNTTGLLVDPESPGAVEAALRTLIRDTKLRHTLGEQAYERVATQFLCSARTEMLKKIYA